MSFREFGIKTCYVAFMHLFACIAFWMWMSGLVGYGFVDRANWSVLVRAQLYVVPKMALTLTFPGRLVFDHLDGWLPFLIVVLSNSLLWAVSIIAAFALIKRRNPARHL